RFRMVARVRWVTSDAAGRTVPPSVSPGSEKVDGPAPGETGAPPYLMKPGGKTCRKGWSAGVASVIGQLAGNPTGSNGIAYRGREAGPMRGAVATAKAAAASPPAQVVMAWAAGRTPLREPAILPV